VKFCHDINSIMLLHEIQIRKWVIVVPLVTSATHGITISEIEADNEITTTIEV
jgi:hypothetical protein